MSRRAVSEQNPKISLGGMWGFQPRSVTDRLHVDFQTKTAEITDAMSRPRHSPSPSRRRLDQTQPCVSFLLDIPKNEGSDLWEWRWNDGRGVALRTGRRQRTFVQQADGLR